MGLINLNNYRLLLEEQLESTEFIYAGDVIDSTTSLFSQSIEGHGFSPDLVTEMLTGVYNQSFQDMVDNCSEMIINRRDFKDLYSVIEELSWTPTILFFSTREGLNLELEAELVPNLDNFIPPYFSKKYQLRVSSLAPNGTRDLEISAFFSPLIKESATESVFYLVDSPIQSLVWSLQNMEYQIGIEQHILSLPVYRCNFQALKIRVVDTQRLRDNKINTVIYDH